LRLGYLAPVDGRWPSHALPCTPLSQLVRPAQRAVALRLRAMAQNHRRQASAGRDSYRDSLTLKEQWLPNQG